uniref:C2H2-type domain-containing protein n=1 Tax=Rodentolepis nana TaxID=102285 RepID=A0A0R3TL82_RODNA
LLQVEQLPTIDRTLNEPMKLLRASHRGVKSFKCELCGNHFFAKFERNSDSDERPCKCRKCGKTFTRQSNLTRPFKCGECKQAFKRKQNFTVHIRSHTGEKQYICGECNKGFAVKSNLKKHVRGHTGERPNRRKVCGKGYKEQGHMRKRMRCHIRDDQFKCRVCGMRFSNMPIPLFLWLYTSDSNQHVT